MAVNDSVGANQYRLIDPNDQSEYLSVQSFTDNAINPCVESTYAFVTHVIQQVEIICISYASFFKFIVELSCNSNFIH